MTTTAPTGLDAAQRSVLERLVTRARKLMETDLSAQVEGRFGIHLDGTIEDEATLPDNTANKVTRHDLEEIIGHLRALGEDAPGAVARLIREAAFTHLNRLIAIRIAEAIGLLPESLAAGPQSRGFRDLGEVMPPMADDYRTYLRLCGDELAGDAPALFDPRNPLLAVEPSNAAFDGLISLLADVATTEIWQAADTLGWVYQFFNDREVRKTAAPQDSTDLAVRNQFFTPRYVVDFLVQNTLGRRLLENEPETPLRDGLTLIIDPPSQEGPSLDLDELAILDPAVGSGHFLLGCYDVLERAWAARGLTSREAAPRIVNALWGIDIDPRCAQVASAAIMIRARRVCPDGILPSPNVITARALPREPRLFDRIESSLAPDRRQLLNRMTEALGPSAELGSLLKAEELLEKEIRRSVFGSGPVSGTLAESLDQDSFSALESDLLGALRELGDGAAATAAERLFAAEAADTVRFVEAMQRRFDVVLMNPPFGEPIPNTKPYLKAAYPWIPWKDYNLLAAFVGRGTELLKPGGYLGAVTSRTGFFLSSFEKWRREVLLSNRFVAMLDLGYHVMEGARVEAAAYVVGKGSPNPTSESVFIRLLDESDLATAIRRIVTGSRAGEEQSAVVRVPQVELSRTPAAVFAYWDPSGMRGHLVNLPQLEGAQVKARVGLQTSDDVRFLRLLWEIDARRCATSRAETRLNRPWVPFAKGGEYSPYYSDFELVVNWEDDGCDIRAFEKAVVRNQQHYFVPGVTWPERTTSAFGPQAYPCGLIFSVVGPLCRVDDERDRLVLLAWMNSRPVRWVIESSAAAGDEASASTAARHYTVGGVQRLPWIGPTLHEVSANRIAELAKGIVLNRSRLDETDETTRRFVAPGALRCGGGNLHERTLAHLSEQEEDVLNVLDDHAAIDEILLHELGVTPGPELDQSVGPCVGRLPDGALSVEQVERFTELYRGPLSDVLEAATQRVGVVRFVKLNYHVIDRRLEMLAIALDKRPAELVHARRDQRLLPPDEPTSTAEDAISYLIGVAVGRWDVRVAGSPLSPAPVTDIFAPLAPCPPGMLIDADGWPALDAPDHYPLEFSPGRLLLDEPGHRWDVEAAVRRASIVLTGSEELVDETLEALRRPSLRDYFRKAFFKDHLSRYSKSRRNAPIYWPLTVPSRSWGVWVYAPMLTRETLYAVAIEAGRRERLVGEAIAHLQREQQEGAAGRPARKVAEELDTEDKLAEELRRFRVEAERIAGLGWTPDLDDGIVLCAAPLADLFPIWPDAHAARAELRKGMYQWATVAAWADQL